MVSSSCVSLIRQSIAEEMSNTAHPVLNSSLLMDEEDEEKLRRMKEEEKLFFFFFVALILLLRKPSWDRIKTLPLLIPSHHRHPVTTCPQRVSQDEREDEERWQRWRKGEQHIDG